MKNLLILISFLTLSGLLVGCSSWGRRIYQSTDVDACNKMVITCDGTRVPFRDDTGCGCEIKQVVYPEGTNQTNGTLYHPEEVNPPPTTDKSTDKGRQLNETPVDRSRLHQPANP